MTSLREFCQDVKTEAFDKSLSKGFSEIVEARESYNLKGMQEAVDKLRKQMSVKINKDFADVYLQQDAQETLHMLFQYMVAECEAHGKTSVLQRHLEIKISGIEYCRYEIVSEKCFVN